MFYKSHQCNNLGRRQAALLFIGVLLALLCATVLPAQAARKYVPKSGPTHARVQTPVKAAPAKPTPKEAPSPQSELDSLIAANRYFEALRWIELHQPKTGCNGPLVLQKSQVFRYQQRFTDALGTYQRILTEPQCKPWHSAAQWQQTLTRLEDLEKAATEGRSEDVQTSLPVVQGLLLGKTRQAPTDATGWAALSRLQLLQQHFKDAQKSLAQAQALSSQNPMVQLARCQWLYATGQGALAKPVLYKLKAQLPHQPLVSLLLAQISLKEGSPDDAHIQLEKLLDIQPDFTPGLRLFAQVHMAKNQPAEAQTLLEKAVALNPNDVSATQALLRLYDGQNLSEQGLLLLKTLSTSAPNQPFYPAELMRRFLTTHRTVAAWDVGSGYVLSMSRQQSFDRLSNDWLSIFSRVVYQARSRQLAANQIRQHASVQSIKALLLQRVRQKPGNLGLRVQLVRLDPFVSLPTIPYTYVATPERMGDALEIAFLEGDWPVYRRLLQDAARLNQTMPLVARLLAIGDYRGAQTLYRAGEDPNTVLLGQEIERVQSEASLSAKSLKMLPAEFPLPQWKESAQQALALDPGNASLRALVAQKLESVGDWPGALEQYRLAVLFATNGAEKQLWQRKLQHRSPASHTNRGGGLAK